ncbi:F-box At1g70590, partial [Olea europaea subsp. europaea]
GIAWYRKAAELGDPTGQCDLADPPNTKEAIAWLYKASAAGQVQAQCQLALCWHQGRVLNQTYKKWYNACWYLRAAEGGYVRAMYNTSLCYSFGEGLVQSHRLTRQWMKKAADRGHSKVQFEHGLGLFSEGEMMKAVIYLELATRAGETAAAHVKNVIVQQLSTTSCDRAMHLANNWHAIPSNR